MFIIVGIHTFWEFTDATCDICNKCNTCDMCDTSNTMWQLTCVTVALLWILKFSLSSQFL